MISQFNESDAAINVPFQKVFLDILGPFQTDPLPMLYVVTLVDCYSRFAICEPTILTPTSKDVITALRKVYELFHSLPDVIRMDRGTQFTSDDFCRTAIALQSRIEESPVDTSWTNGRVERLHRIVNERLRANYDQKWLGESAIFIELIKQITREYNTTPSENLHRSPHDAIFTIRPFLYPELKQYRKAPIVDVIDDGTQPSRGILVPHQAFTVGQIYKVRRKRTRKSDVIYQPCRIIEKISTKIYRIQLPNKAHVTEHERNISEISQEAYEKLPANFQLPPENERPLRSLRGGGGMLQTAK